MKSVYSQTRSDQYLVDLYFEATSSYWDDVYRRDDVDSLIYRQRSDIALSWVDHLGLRPGSAVLEVGCGAGLVAVALARRGFNVHATDTVTAMIELARTRAAEGAVSDMVEVTKGDAHALDFENATFDLVIALGVIPWLHDPDDALREMARVLKPGGALIASVDNVARLHHLLDPKLTPRLARARIAVKRMVRIRSRGDLRSHLHSREEVERLLSAAGIVKQKGRTFGYGPFTFLGHRMLPERIGVGLHKRLQRLADQGSERISSRGAQYVVFGRKKEA